MTDLGSEVLSGVPAPSRDDLIISCMLRDAFMRVT